MSHEEMEKDGIMRYGRKDTVNEKQKNWNDYLQHTPNCGGLYHDKLGQFGDPPQHEYCNENSDTFSEIRFVEMFSPLKAYENVD